MFLRHGRIPARARLTGFLLAAAAALAGATTLAAKQKTELVIVVNDETGDPVSRASVVISRLKGKKSNKIKGQPLQIKTSQQGTAPLPPLRQGVYMVQVISEGYQTHGGKVELVDPEQTHVIVLQPPQSQFSVHTAESQ